MSFDPFSRTPPRLTPEMVHAWIIEDNADVIVFNKPGWVVCHPSKDGPFSSLVGAAREVLELDRVHLVSRLDRETSGLVILARHRDMARRLQVALAERRVEKRYRAILHGRLERNLEVSQPLGPDLASPVAIKQAVGPLDDAQKAQTSFRPLERRGDFTLAEVVPHTGRKHQIRAHAQWAGFPIAGDKLYGPDPQLYLDFVEQGWTARHAALLPLRRQALHAHCLVFETDAEELAWEAPFPEDLRDFWNTLPEEQPVVADEKPRRRRRHPR